MDLKKKTSFLRKMSNLKKIKILKEKDLRLEKERFKGLKGKEI